MTDITFDGKPVKKLRIMSLDGDIEFTMLKIEMEDGKTVERGYWRGEV